MKFKALIVLLAITAILLVIYTIVNAEDRGYNYNTITNGNNSTTTYIDRSTNKTYGNRNSKMGNTTKNDSAKWDTISTINGNITTYTYTNKKTGEVTGGSTWKNGNTTRGYGTSPPHPYNN